MKKKLIIIIIISLILTILIIFNILKKPSNHDDNFNNISNAISNTKKSKKDFVKTENIIIEPTKQQIYGYDENAMQVENFYDGFEACGYLEIEKTNLSMPILSNQSVSGMEYSCCLLYSSGEFNLTGNSYIVAHNYNNETLFSNNKKLQIGDKIVVTGLHKNRIEYEIYNIFNTTPTDTSYLTKKVNENDIEITLQTCNNDDADTRLIIQAIHHKK